MQEVTFRDEIRVHEDEPEIIQQHLELGGSITTTHNPVCMWAKAEQATRLKLKTSWFEGPPLDSMR